MMKPKQTYRIQLHPTGVRIAMWQVALLHLLIQKRITAVRLLCRLASLWLLAVVCGCLGLFGIGFSTLSAHPVSPPLVATRPVQFLESAWGYRGTGGRRWRPE